MDLWAEDLNKREEAIKWWNNELTRRESLLVENEKESKKPKMAALLGSINEFSRSDNWTLWHERLEQFFLANDVKDEKKAALFLTLIGKEGYAILRNLCAPDLPSSKNYIELASIMKSHMDPKPNVMLERYKFKQCRQDGNEEIKEYVQKLKMASTYCEFGQTQKDNMRDQFV